MLIKASNAILKPQIPSPKPPSPKILNPKLQSPKMKALNIPSHKALKSQIPNLPFQKGGRTEPKSIAARDQRASHLEGRGPGTKP